MEGNVLGIMGKSHVEEGHEKRENLHMLGKSYEEDNMDQAPIEIEEKGEVFFSIRNMADHFPYDQQIKFLVHPLIGWIETPWE